MLIKRAGMPLVAICGPSGVGKTVIAQASKLTEVISYTSRPQRSGEINGKHYHFRPEGWMERNKDTLFIIDYKLFKGFHYGATNEELLTKDCIVIKLEDALEYAKEGSDIIIIVIDGPAREERAGRNIEQEVAQFEKIVAENVDYVYSTIANDGTIVGAAEVLNTLYDELKEQI